jgi:succinoglycan biosynthesis transport protein ExoP
MEKAKLLSSSDKAPVSLVPSEKSGVWQIGPSRPGSGGEADVHYRALLRRYFRSMAAIMLSCLAAGLLVTFFITPAYKAKALIEILAVNQDFMNNKDIDPNVSGSSTESYIETQTKLLTSESVADRVQASLLEQANDDRYEQTGGVAKLRRWIGLPQAPRETLKAEIQKTLGTLKVKAEGQSSLISITVSGPTAQIAADTANAVATQHILALQDARNNTATQTTEFLSSQLDAQLKKLRTSEEALQSYSKRTGLIYSPDANHESIAAEKLREVQAELQKSEADRADKQAQLELANSSSPDALPKVLDDGSLREANSRLTDLQRQLATLSATYTPSHYKVIEVQSQIAALEKQVAQGRASIVTRINNDYKTAVRKEALDKGEYNRQLAFVTDQSSKEVGYNILKREVDANRDLYQSMLQKIKEASVVAALRASNIRIVDHAKPPAFPYQPNVFLNEAIAMLAGCMLSVLFVLIRERSDGSIRTAGETVRLLQLPELAIIPSARRDIRTQIVSGSSRRWETGGFLPDPSSLTGTNVSNDLVGNWLHTGSVVAESFRSAVASIILWGRERALAHKVLVVTSAHPRAGKTTSVLNLGLGLVESGRRVLLIDGDLRLPRLGTIFGLEAAPGLTNILTIGVEPRAAKELIQETGLPGLHVLPSGPRQRNVTQMLHLKGLETLIENLRRDYDFILIDSPPVIPLTDARLLAQHADGVILVVRAGATTPEQSINVQQCFAQDGTFVFGSILNDWDARAEDPSFMNSYLKYAGAGAAGKANLKPKPKGRF